MIQRSWHRWGLGLGVVVLLASIGVLSRGPSVQAAAPAAQARGATAQVTIENFAFSPKTLTVAVGTKVVWTQKDQIAHTVTSDTNAWTSSDPLAQGTTFSFTFTKPGTYTYHCMPHPYMKGTIIVTAAGATGTGSTGGTSSTGSGMASMGPMTMGKMAMWTGYYDGVKLMYVSTDTSSKAQAAAEHINYAPSLAKSLPNTSEIYLVTNGAFASRGAVFGSQPGADDYTPLWQEVLVTWKDPTAAVALGKDDQIKDLAKAGKVTLKMTGIVLNCPIIMNKSGGHM